MSIYMSIYVYICVYISIYEYMCVYIHTLLNIPTKLFFKTTMMQKMCKKS